MVSLNHGTAAEEAVAKLQQAYAAYMAALQEVVDLGDQAIPVLVAALTHKRANPVAQALGLLMASPAAETALPRLLDWAIGQWPIYPDVREALLRAGPKVLPLLLARLERHAQEDDDEAVRNLLDVAVHLPDLEIERVIPRILELLQYSNPHIREAAVDALWQIGSPGGRPAVPALLELASQDVAESVRNSAREALTRLGHC